LLEFQFYTMYHCRKLY